DINIGGRIGQIRTQGSFWGDVTVENRPQDELQLPPVDVTQDEMEAIYDLPSDQIATIDGYAFERFKLFHLDGRFSNNTFETAQRLTSLFDQQTNSDVVRVAGHVM